MIKLMKYLKKSAGYIVLIIGLLFLQAYCDLSLPDYTSKVINVGIQQGGNTRWCSGKNASEYNGKSADFYGRRHTERSSGLLCPGWRHI